MAYGNEVKSSIQHREPDDHSLEDGTVGAVASIASAGAAVGAALGSVAGLPGMAAGVAIGGTAGAMAGVEILALINPSEPAEIKPLKK